MADRTINYQDTTTTGDNPRKNNATLLLIGVGVLGVALISLTRLNQISDHLGHLYLSD